MTFNICLSDAIRFWVLWDLECLVLGPLLYTQTSINNAFASTTKVSRIFYTTGNLLVCCTFKPCTLVKAQTSNLKFKTMNRTLNPKRAGLFCARIFTALFDIPFFVVHDVNSTAHRFWNDLSNAMAYIWKIIVALYVKSYARRTAPLIGDGLRLKDIRGTICEKLRS